MRVRSIGCAVCAGALALAAQGLWPAPAPVSAQSPLLRCDAPFPTGVRAAAASRHDCWLQEAGGQSAVPWPGPGSFAEGSVVTAYSLRWSGGGALRLFCSAESARGEPYDRWFAAAAVRGGSTLERASYGVRAASVPAGDRLVSSFFGGRPARVEWERGSRYDARTRRWVSRRWRVEPSVSPPTPAFMRPPPAPGDEEPPTAVRRPQVRSGYTCPEFGLFARQLGDRVDPAAAGPGVPARCLSPAGAGRIFDGDEFNVQAQYLPGRGTFGGGGGWGIGTGGMDYARGAGRGATLGGRQGSNPDVPDGQGCGGENNAVCSDASGGNGNDQDPAGRTGGNPNAQTPQQGQGRVAATPHEPPGDGLGRGRRLADAPVVAAFSSGMACVERESIVLRRYRRRSWVDTSYAEYDPTCDLSGVVLPPGTPSPPGLRPPHCDTGGFDLAGNPAVPSGYWNTWWEHVWEPNAAETDPHLPWARVFWHDGGGASAFESGGVLVGDDGTAACLIGRGFVRSPALPAIVPAVAGRLAGTWTDYASGAVPVECPKEDGTAGLTSAPIGSPAPAFDVLASVDFAPLIHEEAMAESFALQEYRSSRPCSDWPDDADPAPVAGVDCGVDLPVSAARRRRLDSFRRQVRTSAGTGRITSFFLDDAASMMSHSWDVRGASALAGVLELDTPWDAGADVGAGVAVEARRFGAPSSSWTDCGRRDLLMGRGTDSLWGAWVERARSHRAAEVAGSVGLLRLAEGLDGRTTVSCTPGGDCRPVPGAFLAHQLAIEEEARRLGADRDAEPDRVCGIGDRVSPPGP